MKRLRAKAGFWTHLAVYLAVNAFLVMIWFFTGQASSLAIFPIGGGIGLAANAWDVFGSEPVTEERTRVGHCVYNQESVTRHLTQRLPGRSLTARPSLPVSFVELRSLAYVP